MLPFGLWTEIQEHMLCLPYTPLTHTCKEMTPCVLPLYLWMKEKGGMTVQFMQTRRTWVLEHCLCCLGRHFRHFKIAWNSSSAHMVLNMYLLVVCPVCHGRSISEVMYFEFLQPKWLKCSLEVVRKEWSPLQTSAQGTPLTRRIWISKKILWGVSWLLKGNHLPSARSRSTNWAPHPPSSSKHSVTLDELARHSESVNTPYSVNKLFASPSLAQSIFQLHEAIFYWLERGRGMK